MAGGLPQDIANQVLDCIGSEVSIGDLQEGTREANVLLRAYGQCLRQLLRCCHWDFARRQAPLALLADASGQTPNVGQLVPAPWLYEYAYPIDAMKVRFVPQNYLTNPPNPPGNIVPPNNNSPLMTGLQQPPLLGAPLRPARFILTSDPNYPPAPGQVWWETQGVSPEGRTVILTNVKNAQLVYTAFLPSPSVWDSQFRAAFVAYLASEVALPLTKDKKFGMAIRDGQIKIAVEKIREARVTNGNEGTQINDISVDWMRSRVTGSGSTGYGPGWENGAGGFGWAFCAPDSIAFGNGAVY